MKNVAICLVTAGLVITELPPSGLQRDGAKPILIAGKNSRVVDMCWIKNGKKYCFKKRVCD
ncbi:MAG: hypothetical protein ABL907_04785 [Hyphomicrobium sp.]